MVARNAARRSTPTPVWFRVGRTYRELEYSGLVTGQSGVGTFIQTTLADASLAAHGPLREQLHSWLAAARHAGLDEESIEALIEAALRTESSGAGPATATGAAH